MKPATVAVVVVFSLAVGVLTYQHHFSSRPRALQEQKALRDALVDGRFENVNKVIPLSTEDAPASVSGTGASQANADNPSVVLEETAWLKERCSITQPMYCTAQRLETMFTQSSHQFPIEAIVNANKESSPEQTWSFDKNTLTIYNNKHWRGFFPSDGVFNMVKYVGGFWKSFRKEGEEVKGITHPFEFPVNAPNIPQIKTSPKFGPVVHLRYTQPQFALVYDVLKMVDKDTILGKAFVGVFPGGQQSLIFSMSRRYGVDFMTEEDHQAIYQGLDARAPTAEEVYGKWKGQLVSDGAVSPVTQVFTYRKNKDGKLEMKYVFGGLLRGIAKISMSRDKMNMDDFTNWDDEVKLITQDFMLGKWCSPRSKIPLNPLNFALSFLSTEKGPGGDRLCFRYILTREK